MDMQDREAGNGSERSAERGERGRREAAATAGWLAKWQRIRDHLADGTGEPIAGEEGVRPGEDGGVWFDDTLLEDETDAETALEEFALGCAVRANEWRTPDGEGLKADEISITYVTGGPGVCARAEIRDGKASNAWIGYTDWEVTTPRRLTADDCPDLEDALRAVEHAMNSILETTDTPLT